MPCHSSCIYFFDVSNVKKVVKASAVAEFLVTDGPSVIFDISLLANDDAV